MRVVALISGGKDSCYNMMQCVAEGHQIVALANLRPEDKDELDSYMYQTVGHHGIEMYAEAMALPLYRTILKGQPINQQKDYTHCEGDEVEDLYELLDQVKRECGVEGVSVGAILSDYQRVRVEHVCVRLGLTSLAYLWRRDQTELLSEMVQCGVHAILIKVAALGLEPKKHLGKTLSEILPHMLEMEEKYGLNVCGEGGEYETFTLDCPLFNKKIVIDETNMVYHSDDAFAPVAYLNLTKLHLQDKNLNLSLPLSERLHGLPMKTSCDVISELEAEFGGLSLEKDTEPILPRTKKHAPLEPIGDVDTVSVCHDGDSLWVGGIIAKMVDFTVNGNVVVEITKKTMDSLKAILSQYSFTMSDVVMVHLYVADMTLFAGINEVYKTYFDINPPSRVCVETVLPSDVIFQLDCYVCSKSRSTMHVQGLSHWAPANIGPYSQVVKIDERHYIAGQIPLIGGNMEVIEGAHAQCRLSLRHANRIMKAMHLASGIIHSALAICYVTDIHMLPIARQEWELYAAKITSDRSANPLCEFFVVTELPRGVQVEWQVVAVSDRKQSISQPRIICECTDQCNCSGTYGTYAVAEKCEGCFYLRISCNIQTLQDVLVMSENALRNYKLSCSKGCLFVFFQSKLFKYSELLKSMQDLTREMYGDNRPAVVAVPVCDDGTNHLLSLCYF